MKRLENRIGYAIHTDSHHFLPIQNWWLPNGSFGIRSKTYGHHNSWCFATFSVKLQEEPDLLQHATADHHEGWDAHGQDGKVHQQGPIEKNPQTWGFTLKNMARQRETLYDIKWYKLWIFYGIKLANSIAATPNIGHHQVHYFDFCYAAFCS